MFIPPVDYKTTAGSTVRVWQVRAGLLLLSEPAIDHPTTPPPLPLLLLAVSDRIKRAQPRAQTTDNNSIMQRACLYPRLTTKIQPCRTATAAPRSTMRVWEVRAVLWPVAFVGACDRSPDHTTTTSLCRCLLLAV